MFLEISQNLHENTSGKVSFLKRLRPATLFKKKLWHRGFPVNFTKSLRTSFVKEHPRWLLLYVVTFETSMFVAFQQKKLNFHKIAFIIDCLTGSSIRFWVLFRDVDIEYKFSSYDSTTNLHPFMKQCFIKWYSILHFHLNQFLNQDSCWVNKYQLIISVNHLTTNCAIIMKPVGWFV